MCEDGGFGGIIVDMCLVWKVFVGEVDFLDVCCCVRLIGNDLLVEF